MASQVCIIDTNVIVSSVIAADSDSPPVRILEAMLGGDIPYLMSDALLREYSSVLRRPRLTRRHERTDDEIDQLLGDLTANAMWREPSESDDAPDPGDAHLWALLASHPQSQLVTGDRLLLENPPSDFSVISPRDFVDAVLFPRDS